MDDFQGCLTPAYHDLEVGLESSDTSTPNTVAA